MPTEELQITQTHAIPSDAELARLCEPAGDERLPGVRTLRDLLQGLRAGLVLHRPILIEVELGVRFASGDTSSRTQHRWSVRVVDWDERYSGEYSEHPFFLLGSNSARDIESPVMVGRSRRCDITIHHPSVSRQHGSIMYERASGAYYIVDEYSSNGTFINYQALAPGERTLVKSGAFIGFGDAVFVFADPHALTRMSAASR